MSEYDDLDVREDVVNKVLKGVLYEFRHCLESGDECYVSDLIFQEVDYSILEFSRLECLKIIDVLDFGLEDCPHDVLENSNSIGGLLTTVAFYAVEMEVRKDSFLREVGCEGVCEGGLERRLLLDKIEGKLEELH